MICCVDVFHPHSIDASARAYCLHAVQVEKRATFFLIPYPLIYFPVFVRWIYLFCFASEGCAHGRSHTPEKYMPRYRNVPTLEQNKRKPAMETGIRACTRKYMHTRTRNRTKIRNANACDQLREGKLKLVISSKTEFVDSLFV